MATRHSGEMKWFDTTKRYGLIKQHGSGVEIYCHIDQFPSDTQPFDVRQGMPVTFEVLNGDASRGPMATNIMFGDA
ncbi:cold shock domain-containing protein [Nocardia sp. NPDC051832]|uniref:cold shock domain-containing protein n=1 Tax=Nocardia sp. NPDC051832 TaxID=3155673 RepID=UPI00343D11AE